jgi:hypothetical protein
LTSATTSATATTTSTPSEQANAVVLDEPELLLMSETNLFF